MVRRLSLRLNIAASATATEIINNNHIKQDKYYIMEWFLKKQKNIVVIYIYKRDMFSITKMPHQ